MFEFVRKPIFLLIVGAALVIAAIWAWSSNRSSTTNNQTVQQQQNQATEASADKISNLTNVDASTISESVTAQLVIADQKAGEVDKKLQLSAVQVILNADLKPGSGTTYYVYTTPNDKVNNWIIAMSNSDNTFVRSRTPKADYIGDLTPINRSFIKLNYAAALQAAEKDGGLSSRQAHIPTSVRITLKNSDPKSWLYWFVEYVSDQDTKQFEIDANTGVAATASADDDSDIEADKSEE